MKKLSGTGTDEITTAPARPNAWNTSGMTWDEGSSLDD